jgi:hypothetical protein
MNRRHPFDRQINPKKNPAKKKSQTRTWLIKANESGRKFGEKYILFLAKNKSITTLCWGMKVP